MATEFANKQLVYNLRFKFPELGNYSDEELVAAYDEWFIIDSSAPGSDEADFKNYLKEKE